MKSKIEQEQFKQSVDVFFKHIIIIPSSQITATPAFPQTVYTRPVCIQCKQRLQKRDTVAQYERRLALSPWKLISATSLRILYVLLRSVINSNAFHAGCVPSLLSGRLYEGFPCNFTSDTTHILTTRGVSLALNSQYLSAIYSQNRVQSPLYLHFSLNVILTVSTCTRHSCY